MTIKREYIRLYDGIQVPDNLHESLMSLVRLGSTYEEHSADMSMEQPYKKRKIHLKRPAIIAIAALLILAIGTTAFAAANGIFTRGLASLFNADAKLQDELQKAHIVTVYGEEYAVTIDNITIEPTVLLTDGTRMYLSFKVRNYDTGEYIRPEFSKHVEIDVYDGIDLRTSYGMGGSMGFYSEVVSENNPYISEDLEYDTDASYGLSLRDYYDAEHNLEYIISVGIYDLEEGDTIFGKTIYAEFSGISSYNSNWLKDDPSKTDGTYWAVNTVEGPWIFNLKIPEMNELTKKYIREAAPVDNSPIWKGVYVDSVDITPLRITVHTHATEEAEIIRYFHVDGWYEYDRTSAVVTKIRLNSGEIVEYQYDRILEPDEIDAIYVVEAHNSNTETYYDQEVMIELKQN